MCLSLSMSCEVVKQFLVEDEYKKETGIGPQDIKKLRVWLCTQPHLPWEHITDLDLILIYHCCDRSIEVSKQLLDLHYTMRTLFDRLFKNRAVDDRVENALKSFLVTVLPKRTAEGYAVVFNSFLERDAKNLVMMDAFRASIMVLDLWQYENGTCPGIIIIADMSRMTFGHLAKQELQAVQQFLYFLQEAMLANLKGIHYINAPSSIDKLLMVMRPFLKKSLMETIFVHPAGSCSLENIYPIEELPKESGGNYKSFEECREQVSTKLKANKEFFEIENKKRVSEILRPGKPKTISDIFGSIEGSFKNLELD